MKVHQRRPYIPEHPEAIPSLPNVGQERHAVALAADTRTLAPSVAPAGSAVVLAGDWQVTGTPRVLFEPFLRAAGKPTGPRWITPR